MNTVKVLGYSERGVINSIIFYLREHPELMGKFLKALEIELPEDFGEDVEYTLLNEQSFSDFGDSDLVIIAKNKDNKKIVVFVEGKVKTSQGHFSLDTKFEKVKVKDKEDFKGISSNIFVQLYYKYLLTQLDGKQEYNCSEIGKEAKKLGDNDIVKKAYNVYIKGAEQYYFVAILPIESNDFQSKFKELNLNMPTENIRCVYWGNIEELFIDNPVAENFFYNKGQIY
jgi:hypothetical protein